MNDKLKEAIKYLKEVSEMMKQGYLAEAIDTVVSHCEQKTYTPAEMEAFWIWAYEDGWYYGTIVEEWGKEVDGKNYTIEDVLKIWEESNGSI